jgi:AcrR family transcriptional regulator
LSTTGQRAIAPRRRLTAQARRELIEREASELFAERGYAGTTIDAIAAASGVTAPVVYDHFASKLDLHTRLLERHYADLRGVWQEQLQGEEPRRQAIPRAIDAWFAYVEEHPYAWRMLFRDTTGEADVQAAHEQVIAQSREAITPLFLEQIGVEWATDGGPEAPEGTGTEALDMAWVIMRGVLQGLALWWYEHQHVPRAQVVAAAMNGLWIGFERVLAGDAWQPPSAGAEPSS